MCGIAGFVLAEGNAASSTIRAMCDVIRHRGPDDEGFHVAGRCAIGMRRLSIIDLSTGHQPISNEDGSVWVVFNGEIYNFQELRETLLGQGHRFTTNSDTETLVHLYEQEGVEGLPKLRGMFGYAIWDQRRQQLLLVRDRFGKKPLYYTQVGAGQAAPAGLYFGSELKCLRAAGVPLEIDRDALRLYFQFTYIPDPHSPFRGVRKLPAGGWLLYNAATGEARQGRYWRFPVPAEHAGAGYDEARATRQLRDLFDESVRLRMIADVPLGAFLSGGIDSSSVVASMALQSREPVKTFSIGFEESDFNELPYARQVAELYKTEHHEILVRPDSVSLITRLVRHFDEPFADSSAIPTFLVSEFAARHVKVALSGDGGDELFAGYRRFAEAERQRGLDRVPVPLRNMLSWLAGQLPYSAYGKNYLRIVTRPNALERYFENTTVPYFLRERLLRPDWMLPADGAYLTRTFADFLLPNGADILSQALYFETTANLPGDMLVKVDRMSMANSLEVRCPLLDHRLGELAASLPPRAKLRGERGKYLLVEAMRERLPPALPAHRKMGFAVPLAQWFRGSLREYLSDYLGSERFLGRGIVSPPFVRTLLEEHATGRRDNNLYLWSLLILELWFRDLEEHAAA